MINVRKIFLYFLFFYFLNIVIKKAEGSKLRHLFNIEPNVVNKIQVLIKEETFQMNRREMLAVLGKSNQIRIQLLLNEKQNQARLMLET